MSVRIMIIDAHPVYAQKTAGFLGALAFREVETVSCGLKAMQAALTYRPDVVVLSAVLPDADSVALAAEIKSRLPFTAIIVQTGLLTGPQAVEDFKAAGVDHVVARKEKDWSVFEAALKDVLRAR